MNMTACLLLPALLTASTIMPAEDISPAPAPAEDRVGFPKDFAATFAVLRTVVRDEGAKIVTVYGNAAAANVTTMDQLPYPYGAINYEATRAL